MQCSQSQLPPNRRGSAQPGTVPSYRSTTHSAPTRHPRHWRCCLGEEAGLVTCECRGFEEMRQDSARRSVAMLALCSALLLAAAPAYLASAAPVEDGLLSNGDFETAPTGGFSKSASVADGASSIPDWLINGTVELISAGQHQGGMILIVPQGDHAVRLGNDASISRVVQVEKGSEYAITFSAARTCAQLEALNVSVLGGVSQTVDLQTLYNIEGWDAYALAFQATDEEAHIQFMNPGMEDDPTCGPILDNVAVKKLFTPDKPKDNVVINGDFEEGPWMFPNTSFGVLLPTNLDEQTSALPGWMIESNRAVRYVDSDEYKVPQGKRAVELLSGKEGIISQMVETTPEKVYSLTFTLGSAGDSCQPPMAVMAFAGDQAQNFHYSPMGNATSQAANVTFTARAERTRVAFYSVYYNTRSDDHTSLCGPVIDEIRVWGLNAAVGLKASIGLVLGIVVVVGMVLF